MQLLHEGAVAPFRLVRELFNPICFYMQVVRGAWIFAMFGGHAVAVLLAIWLWPGRNQTATWWKVRQLLYHVAIDQLLPCCNTSMAQILLGKRHI